MKLNMIRKRIPAVLCAAVLMSSCADTGYEGFDIPDQGGSDIEPVAQYTQSFEFEDTAPEEPTLETFSSSDNICTIEKKEHYYNVILDLEQGDHYAAGAAYADAILAAAPDYSSVFEPYLYENIHMAFSETNEKSFESLTARVTSLKDSLDDDYRLEIEGFADRISGGTHGFEQNGALSYEEALTMQMVPDALRGTACSAVTLDGSRTQSGERLTARVLEWLMGSSNQLAEIQTVLRYKNGSHSITTVSALGLLDVISGYNDSGVLAGILDAGSGGGDNDYIYEGRTCYTYALRYALENFTTAREAGEYMTENADRFTYSHNVFLTDKDSAFCAEDSVTEGMGKPVLRTEDTPTRGDFPMTAEGAFFVVNCCVSEGSRSPERNGFSLHDLVRWRKYNEWFGGSEVFTAGSLKARLACETKECYDRELDVINSSTGAFHVLVLDYSTGIVQATFMRPDAEGGKPLYIKIAQI